FVTQGEERSIDSVLELRICLADRGADGQLTLRVPEVELAEAGNLPQKRPRESRFNNDGVNLGADECGEKPLRLKIDLAVPSTLVGELVAERHRLHADELALQPFDRCHPADGR